MSHHIEKLGEEEMFNGKRWVMRPLDNEQIQDKINEIIDFLNTLPAHKGEPHETPTH